LKPDVTIRSAQCVTPNVRIAVDKTARACVREATRKVEAYAALRSVPCPGSLEVRFVLQSMGYKTIPCS
jgi:hypothetical protein